MKDEVYWGLEARQHLCFVLGPILKPMRWCSKYILIAFQPFHLSRKWPFAAAGCYASSEVHFSALSSSIVAKATSLFVFSPRPSAISAAVRDVTYCPTVWNKEKNRNYFAVSLNCSYLVFTLCSRENKQGVLMPNKRCYFKDQILTQLGIEIMRNAQMGV